MGIASAFHSKTLDSTKKTYKRVSDNYLHQKTTTHHIMTEAVFNNVQEIYLNNITNGTISQPARGLNYIR